MAQNKIQLFGMSPPVNADEIAYGGGTVADALSGVANAIAVMYFYDGSSHLTVPVGETKEVDVSSYNIPYVGVVAEAMKYITEFEYYTVGGIRQYAKVNGTNLNANLPALCGTATEATVNYFNVSTTSENGIITKYVFNPRTVSNSIVVVRIIVSRIMD